MTDILAVVFMGAVTLALGPKDKFRLLFCIFLTCLITYTAIETETFTTCVWQHSDDESIMLCREFTRLR